MLSFLLLGEAPAAASSPQPLVPGERQCNTPSAEPVTDELDADGRPRWSRFYSVKDVCLAIRPEACGMRLDVGFGQDSDDFDPLHALRQWVDLFEAGCGGTPLEAVRKAGTGVALTVQHINTYNQDSLQHQAASLLAMYADADKDMQTRLARTTSVVLPQYSSRVQLDDEMQWLEGMLGVVLPKCVLPNKCNDGQRELYACAELAEPTCFDELIIHRQVGPWRASHEQQQEQSKQSPDAAAAMGRGRQLFANASEVRRFQWRAASTLHLPSCSPPSEKLTATLAVRRDSRGYANWEEIIAKAKALVARHPPWRLELWEPKAEELAGQAQRLACTDLLVTVQGAHATNMIFMPPRAGVLFTARCGCRCGPRARAFKAQPHARLLPFTLDPGRGNQVPERLHARARGAAEPPLVGHA